ncbi:hypothetical protein CL621_02440 [archaeon]|nr:hypothetical protein [archaeon]|tara:strand:+ start:3489 stop:4901 length:1413 start_codon:yes stop_codon:yes gene_type:complete
MKYKNLLLVLFFLVVFVNFVSATQNILTIGNEFRIDLIKYDPSPLEPGKSSDIWFEIRNLGDKDIHSFEVNLANSFPLTVESDRTIYLSRLEPGKAIPFKFTIHVNENVQDGDYKVSLHYYSKTMGTGSTNSFTIPIKRINRVVSATTAKVTGSTVKIDPGKILPGEISEVLIGIQNTAAYLMKDITIKLDLSSDDTPLAPIGTTSEKKIEEIPAGESANLIFNLMALPDAESDVYKIPLEISYYDELGNNYTKSDLIGLIIGGDPKFHVEIKESNIYNRKDTGEITINFVNTGLTKIKFLTVELGKSKRVFDFFGIKILEKDNYKILSEDKVYLGDIDPDDDDSVEFRLKLDSPSNKVNLPIKLNFKDGNNNEYTRDLNAELEIYSKKEMGIKTSSNGIKILFVILIVVLLLGYRKWKKVNKDSGFIDYLKHLKEKVKILFGKVKARRIIRKNRIKKKKVKKRKAKKRK